MMSRKILNRAKILLRNMPNFCDTDRIRHTAVNATIAMNFVSLLSRSLSPRYSGFAASWMYLANAIQLPAVKPKHS